MTKGILNMGIPPEKILPTIDFDKVSYLGTRTILGILAGMFSQTFFVTFEHFTSAGPS